MKKITTVLMTLPLFFSAFAFGGCDNKKNGEARPEKIVLCDFEQFEPDFQLCGL